MTGLRTLICSVVGLAGLGWAWPAQAADPPVDAGGLLRQQQAPLPPAAPPPAAPPVAAPARVAPEGDAGLRLAVGGFRIAGEPQVFTRAELLALLDPAAGRTLSLGELRAAVDRITEHYRARGWFLARAVLPPQDVTDGLVTVHVLEGRLDPTDGLRFSGRSRLDPALARALVGRGAAPGAPLRLPDLERGLHLLNDLPGVDAAARLEPGSAPDTTRLVVDLSDAPRWQAVASADNHGSRYTDSDRLGLVASLDNPAGQGDQLSLQAVASPGGDYRYARLGYAIAAGGAGLRLSGSLSDLRYRIGADLAALEARGGASVLGVAARQPLVRSRTRNLNVSAALDLKQLQNEALGVRTADKRIELLSLGLAGDRSDGRGFSAFDLGWAAGTLDLSSDPVALAQDQAGPRTQGSFTRLTLGATRVQWLTAALQASLTLQAQWAPRNLDSSEKFLLGGPQGVRAYPGGEAAGDQGWRASAELRWAVASHRVAGALQLSAFADAGRIRQWARPQGMALATPNAYGLSGAGLGATLTLPSGHQLRLDAAVPLARNPGRNPVTGHDTDGRARSSRWWLSAQFRF